uniref:Cytochrome P450 family 4 subfamily B member 1 n=1 Tax=Gopherus agassizii TaxID=38772 RepID=A0A452HKN3_9SAUR
MTSVVVRLITAIWCWLKKDVFRIVYLLTVLCLTYMVLKAIKLYQWRRKLNKALQSFPGPPVHWLFGNVHEDLDKLLEWSKKYARAFPVWFGKFVVFVSLNDADYAKAVCARGGKRWWKGLLTLQGPKWFQHRKLLTPGFHYGVLKPYVSLITKSTQVMLDKWEHLITQEKSVELFGHVSLMTLDSILKCAFSHESNCQMDRSVFYATCSMDSQHGYCLPVLLHREGGCHSISLACRDDLGKMPNTTMCIKESMRIFPPVPFVGRQLSKPITFHDGRYLPEGTLVGINIYLIHRDPSLWKDPEVFDPMRFSPENSSKRHSHAFMPFSAGARNCIGQQFAMIEMKVAIALSLLRFEFSLNPAKIPRKIPQMVLQSKNGIHVHLKKIHWH